MSMTTLERAAADLRAAGLHVSNIEALAGKKTSPRLRKMLTEAFMSGVRHEREKQPDTGSLLDGLLRGR